MGSEENLSQAQFRPDVSSNGMTHNLAPETAPLVEKSDRSQLKRLRLRVSDPAHAAGEALCHALPERAGGNGRTGGSPTARSIWRSASICNGVKKSSVFGRRITKGRSSGSV
jgi:hypothetical protein